jgi:hypothetical protein
MSSTRSASTATTYEKAHSAALSAASSRSGRIMRLLPVLVAMATAACQPAIHSRQSIAPEWAPAAGHSMYASGGPRFRFASYSVARFSASVATRRWPLMDSHTLAHRYGFDLADENGSTRDVQCVRIAIVGDEARERTTLECTMSGDDGWRIELAGRTDLDGSLVGSVRAYRVERAIQQQQIEGTGAASYYLWSQDAVVAAVPADASAEPWFAPDLEAADRGAVAATVVALLVGRELGR